MNSYQMWLDFMAMKTQSILTSRLRLSFFMLNPSETRGVLVTITWCFAGGGTKENSIQK